MRIKVKNLPPAPYPATKAVRDARYYSTMYGTYMVKPMPSWTEGDGPKKMEELRERRRRKVNARHMEVLELAKQGLSDVEIAERTGYAESSISTVIWKLRERGINVPARPKGRKKNETGD